MKDASRATSRLGLAALLAYGGPGLPMAVVFMPFYILIPTFYGEALGLSAAAIALAIPAARIVDAISDPVVGRLADLSHARIGRRKIWILCGAPFVAASAYMLYAPPDGAGAWHLLCWSIAVALATTAVWAPYSAWSAELSDDYHERNRINAAREALVVIGTLLAASAPAIFTAMGVEGLRAPLTAIAVFVAIMLPVTAVIASFVLPDPPNTTARSAPFSAALPQILSNGPFRRLAFAYFINATANGMPASLILYFVSERLQIPEIRGLMLGLYFLAGLLATPLWLFLAKRWGKHRTWVAAMGWACFIFAFTVFVDGPEDVVLYIAIAALSGMSVTADLILPASMQGDVVDRDTLVSGERRAGLYFALWGFVNKAAAGVSLMIAFGGLYLAGFNTSGGEQTAMALLALLFFYACAPIVLKLWAMRLMWDFPIDAEEQARIRAEIEAKARMDTAPKEE